MSFQLKPGFHRRRERVWDVGMKPRQLIDIFRRRMEPDGFEHNVNFDRTGRVRYPWDRMQDGDFFIAMVGDRSKLSMEVAFRQAAARHDIEVAIHPGTIDGHPCFRVTRVFKGIAMAKRRARGQGLFAPSHDVEARRRARSGDAIGVADTRADALPTPSGPTGGAYDRAALLEQARRRAMEEL